MFFNDDYIYTLVILARVNPYF